MGLYQSICQSNRFLYQQLEDLTTQISFIKASNRPTDISHLESKKDGLKSMIDINLEKLDRLWAAESVVFRRAERISPIKPPTTTELKIILTYQFNSNQTVLAIADKHQVTTNKVSSVITKLLNKEYTGV